VRSTEDAGGAEVNPVSRSIDRPVVNRRQALKTLGTVAAGAATSSMWVESLCAFARQQVHTPAAKESTADRAWKPSVFSAGQNDMVITLTELIIPETDTPGAKAARVNRFIDWVLAGGKAEDRDGFLRGLAWMDRRSHELFGNDFAKAGTENQTRLLMRLSSEPTGKSEDQAGIDFFRAIKNLTIDGYYTTEIGLRQELGDSGQLFQRVSQGCDHPEHQN